MDIRENKADRRSARIITVILTVILAPLIAAYCVLWVIMTVGGGAVKRIFRKNAA